MLHKVVSFSLLKILKFPSISFDIIFLPHQRFPNVFLYILLFPALSHPSQFESKVVILPKEICLPWMDPAFDDEYVNVAHLNFLSYRPEQEILLHLHVVLLNFNGSCFKWARIKYVPDSSSRK